MKIKLLAVSALALALTGCGHSAKSHFEKTYRPTADQPYFKTTIGAAIKLALRFSPTSADIRLDEKGMFNISDNSYSFTGEWSSDDKGEGLFDEKEQVIFYFTEKGEGFCLQEIDSKVPLCYSEVKEQK